MPCDLSLNDGKEAMFRGGMMAWALGFLLGSDFPSCARDGLF